jgi:2-polyprenyl-3-methyl-5-hydroxy-6-metoxy-1,4-benzoquinol methylase
MTANLRETLSQIPHCLACNSTDVELWSTARDIEYCTSAESFSYYRCQACGVLFIDPVPANRLSEIYPPNYYSFVKPGASLAGSVKQWLDTRLFRQVLSAIPGEQLRVLDVGGGAGFQLDTVCRAEPRVRETHIVDLDPGAEAAAREHGHHYHCLRIEDYVAESSFDLVLLLNLLEHVADPGALLRKVRGLLANTGRVIVKTPNYDALDARVYRSKNWAGLHCPRHWVLFTRPSLEALVARSGLKVETFAYTQGAPFWAASALGWLAERGLARISPERPVVYHPLFGPFSAAFAAFDFARMPFSKTSQMFLVLGPA